MPEHYTTANVNQAEIIARSLGGMRSGSGWDCRCPAHKDREPSLSVSDGPDGKTLVHCHAGCSQADVIDALDKLGLWSNGERAKDDDDASEKRPIIPVPVGAPPMLFKHPAYGKPSCTWAYHLADGGLAGFIARFDFSKDGEPNKTYLPITYCDLGNGKRAWRSKGIPAPRPLYRSPQLMERPVSPILVCEGEKSALAAQRLFPDYVATTPMHGAKSPSKTDWSPAKNRTLTIWPDHDQPGSDFALSVARLASDAGASTVAIVHVPDDFPEAWDLADPSPEGWMAERRNELLKSAPAWRMEAEPAEKAAEPKRYKIRPKILGMNGHLAEGVSKSLDALISEQDPFSAVYVRGSMLVRPVRLEDRLTDGGLRRPMNALSLRAVDADWLALRLAQIVNWYKIVCLEERPADPPERVCRSLVAAAPWEGVPMLTGVIEAPTIRPDGSLLIKEGYDKATGLLFDAGGTRFPAVPERPTKGDAEAALKLLMQPFAKFPFLSDADRSVALSSMLSVLVCRVIWATPLFAYSAPKMASGKTLLATIASYVANGRSPYLMSQAQDPTDERKRLLSILIEGPTMAVIDNVERPLQSDALCSAITERTYCDRLLGSTKTVTVESNMLFAATGNNLQLAGDLSSRALLCQLDPKCERPEERDFTVNLHSWVPAHRGELVSAALTIIRAYLVAGSPKQNVPTFGRFEEWQSRCRFPLTWLDCADPCKTRESIEVSDPVRENLRVLLAAWHQQFGKELMTVKNAIKEARIAADEAANEVDGKSPDLYNAMEAVAGAKGGINARRLGRFIARYERRFEGGLRFEKEGEISNAAVWRVSREFSEFSEFSATDVGNPHTTNEVCNYSRTVGKNSQNSHNSPSGSQGFGAGGNGGGTKPHPTDSDACGDTVLKTKPANGADAKMRQDSATCVVCELPIHRREKPVTMGNGHLVHDKLECLGGYDAIKDGLDPHVTRH